MNDESASDLRRRLRILESDIRYSALERIQSFVPRGSELDLSGIRHPLTLRNLEWVTAAYLDLCVTDIHWVESDASGTIEDLIVGGRVIQSSRNHASELRGRVTLDLAERSTFPAAQLCEILHVVEWMQPLRRIEAILPRATRAEIPPTVLHRFGAPFVEATEVAWDSRSSTRTFHGLRVRCTGNRTRSFRLADRFTFDTWALTAIADALDVARS